MKRPKVYLTCMGELFELSMTKYKAYLSEMSRTGSANPSDYGKRLGRVRNVTDLTQSEAVDILSMMFEGTTAV